MSVSRSLKPFVEKEASRPPDSFSHKSCAIQYTYLLENADTPKRKKRESGETTNEFVVRRLMQERIAELNQILVLQREEYLRHKTEVNLLKSGVVADEKLEKMWLDIQQEEREQEQKARTHSVWLAKRQQKQEMISPSTPSSVGNQRKLTESATIEAQEPPAEPSTTKDDEKKSRGGRSPLLTSLLKSPSPTTQMQTTATTPVQVSSPTITSLLGSSPKVLNAQLAQNVSPQLQQLVSTAIASAANATPERPSVGAPTLSMLLEMPASSQRGPLPNLQATSSTVVGISQPAQRPTAVAAEVHSFPQTQQAQNVQITIQNAEIPNAIPTAPTTLAIATPSSNSMPVSENMVQIIDHIDDVIRKDIMADVMDKDEINEIIGDIEELIKEEITAGSPAQTLQDKSDVSTTTSAPTATVINTLPMQTSQQTTEISIPIADDPVCRPEPRDVDEAVSLSDSPQSEMAIEEIDSSTSNIAEIIGTVAIEPQEPKILVAEVTQTVSNMPEEVKSETNAYDERVILSEELVPGMENNESENDKDSPTVVVEEKQLDIEVKPLGAALNVKIEDNEQGRLRDEVKETIEEIVEEDMIEEENEEVQEEDEEERELAAVPDDKDISECAKGRKELAKDAGGKDNVGLDQLEMHLAKITGDQQDLPSAEIVSVSSEVTNDLPSAEDTEKSQDISLILEEEEEEVEEVEEGEGSNQSFESKKKVAVEQVIENTVESTTESLESFKEESVIPVKDEKIVVEVKEETSVKLQEEETVEETLEIYAEESKKEEAKDSSEDTTSSILQDIEIKKEISEPVNGAEDTTTHIVTIEEIENIKSEPIEKTANSVEDADNKAAENTEVKIEEAKIETEAEVTLDLPSEEDRKKESTDVKEEKEEKENAKKNTESEQNIKKETESGIVSAGEEPGELDEEESSLSKLSGGRAMKTYSKRQQNVAVDSETENEGTGEGADYRAWKKAVMLVYNRLATHRYASIFLRPITEDQAPGYHSVIFRPMDLSTIKKNIDNGTIRSTMHFQRDVMLMFQNAIMYNKHDTFIYKMAVLMQEECLQHMQVRKNTRYINYAG